MGKGLPDALLCPRCVQGLTEEKVGGVSIDTCGICGGHWYDAGELTQMRKERDALSPEQRKAIRRLEPQRGQPLEEVPLERAQLRDLCPRCGVKLEPIHYAYSSKIIIDRCSECEGVWLDAGELDQIDRLVGTWESQLRDDEEQNHGLLGSSSDNQPRRGFLRGFLWNLFHHDE
jgi:Zn-finger nucleic acid-binding protein